MVWWFTKIAHAFGNVNLIEVHVYYLSHGRVDLESWKERNACVWLIWGLCYLHVNQLRVFYQLGYLLIYCDMSTVNCTIGMCCTLMSSL